MIFLLNGAIQASTILAVSLLAAYLLRRKSAALRHCVLSAGILFAAVVPGLSLLMPSWNYVLPIQSTASLQPESVLSPPEIPIGELELVQPANSSAGTMSGIPHSAKSKDDTNPVTAIRTAPSIPETAIAAAKVGPAGGMSARKWIQGRSISDVVSWIWVAGLLLTFASLIAGVARLGWIAFHARDAASGEWTRTAQEITSHYGLARPPRLLISSSSLLVTWGWRTPRILLPPGSEDWPADRIRAVLCHELAHVRRGDWVVQMTAELLRGIYWFNPVVWAVCRSLRCESEQASDDAALRCGIADTEYAEHLLDVVRSLRQSRRAWSYALSMAHPSTLERRFKAILNPSANRRALTRMSVIATLGVFLIVALSVSMVRGSTAPAVPLMSAMRTIAAVVAAAPTGAAMPQPIEQVVVSATDSQSEPGIIQGTVQRSDLTAPIAEAQITLEGGPADPRSVQALIQTIATRGVIFNPKRIGTVDDVVRDFTDQSGAQGQGPGFPVFDDAVAAFRATNAARFVGESDMDGRFTIKGVPLGDYIIHVEREGFFDLAARAGTPTKVAVQGKQGVNATLSLTPGGVISGHVRDALGDPQQNVGVQVFAMAFANGYPVLRGSVQKLTDDHGAYRLFWLAPGEYYIGVNPGGTPNADATQRTMYPGTLDLSKAMPVSVRAGEQVSGVDIQLPTDVLPKISGKVTSTIPAEETAQQASLYNAALARPTLMLIGRDPAKPDIGAGTARTIGTVTLNGGTGTFEVAGILPGSYDLYLRIPQSNAQGGAGFSFARVPIDVRNENVTGISITVNHTVNVTGGVTIDGKPSGSTPIRLHFQPDGSGVKLGAYQSVGQRVITPDGNGAFTSLGVPPGLFRMEVEPSLPNDLYLSDVRQGGVSVFDSGIEITSEKPNPLQVVVSSGAGTMEGTALNEAGKPMPGASVVLAPLMMRRQNRALYHTATADVNGKFTIHNLAPGAYQLFAWQQSIPAGAFYNAGFLSRYEDRSRIVNVTAKSTTSEQITAVPLQ
jgi:beta-lactamase regulating signal transducer with metallopeptidase domain